MPPKKTAADSADPTELTSADGLQKGTATKKPAAAAPPRLAARPSTAVMVKEALQALDSRKGVSSQAIQNYIKQKYTTVDLVRLKYLVRNYLKRGIETGTLVRPANSSLTTGAVGKFRLAPKVKETKLKGENADPNVPSAPKAKDGGAKKPKKAGTAKGNPENEETKSAKDLKLPKKAEGAASSKLPPAKKPKSKTTAKKAEEGHSASGKTKPAKTVNTKAPRIKAKAGSDAPAAKTSGKQRKKPVV